MKFIDKVGDTVSQSVDFIIDKNRQAAQLNRLKAIIQNENDNLNTCYVTLGKEYLKVLDGGTADEAAVGKLRENIAKSQLRLKKARARYEYTLRYGVPKPGVNVEEAAAVKEQQPECEKKEEDDQDITIAYADPTAADVSDAIDAEPGAFDEVEEPVVTTGETDE